MLARLTTLIPEQRIAPILDPPPRDADELTAHGEPFTVTLQRYADAGRQLARRYGVRLVDLTVGWDVDRDISDGLHPSEAGTQRVADRVTGLFPPSGSANRVIVSARGGRRPRRSRRLRSAGRSL
jgi:lysophospholipase L1-like esterase